MLFSFGVETLRDWNKEYKDRTLPGFVVDVLEGLMSITHNTAMRADNVTRFRQLDATRVLKLYIDSPHEYEQLSAVITLADIVTEEEADSLATSDDVARLLLDSLRRSLDANCRTDGLQVVELTRGVGQLARNDNNSRLLVKEGVLPLLLRAAHSEHDDETEVALKTLWMLSFHPDNKEEIIKQEELLDLVVAVFRDEKQTKDCRKSAEGILWELRQELKTTDKYRDVAQEFLDNTTHNGSETATSGISSGHVMLSYQWANQALVKDIRDHLKQNGFKVWMDIDDMDESTLQAMADAVEGAAVVLTCVSQKYKDSPNCRAEAEYAFQRRKPIVPIVTQQGYRADGWLGIILGSKLFYDFSGKYPLPDMYPKLVKAVRRVAGGQTCPESTEDVVCPHIPLIIILITRDGAVRCGEDQMLDQTRCRRLAHQVCLEWAPEYFYNTLEKTLDVKPLSGFVHFLKAMDGLPAMVM
nr:hypothetical protein BaRGS_031434 [Batillaria attramentaria]